MTTYLNIDEENLKENNAYWTAREIEQQPLSWRKALKTVQGNNAQIMHFLSPLLMQKDLRIILTGAGTSAYVGDALAPHLSHKTGKLFSAISTTDIVANPELYFQKKTPTLLISYARSGNSPESIAAIKLADEVVDNCFHLVLTCNPEGELALGTNNNDNAFSLIMPQETLDQSFAMTSSYTSMLVSTLCIFTPDIKQLEQVAACSEALLKDSLETIKSQAQNKCNRLVFLGAGPLLGFARESALKTLELTAGKVLSYCESPLGFRHGPKSLVDENTDIILFCSTNAYTKKYDDDLYNELVKDQQALSVLKLNPEFIKQPTHLDDIWVGLVYLVYSQTLSFYKSLELELTPDNPCPTGEVNRVVQGVTIYPLKK